MKKLFLALAITVLGVPASARVLPAGCTSQTKFSPETGMPCNQEIASAAPIKVAVTPSTMTDHWSSLDEALKAPIDAPFYFPTILHPMAPGSGEVIRGLPQDSFLDMDLPDRMGGRGFVKIGRDRKIIYNEATGEPLYLAECHNRIYGGIPIPQPKGRDGRDGKDGRDGRDGIDGRDGRDGWNASNRMDSYYNEYGYPQYPCSSCGVPLFSFGISIGWGSCYGMGYGYNGGSYGANYNYNVNNVYVVNSTTGRPPRGTTGGNNGRPPRGTTGGTGGRPPGGGGTTGGYGLQQTQWENPWFNPNGSAQGERRPRLGQPNPAPTPTTYRPQYQAPQQQQQWQPNYGRPPRMNNPQQSFQSVPRRERPARNH